MFKDPGAPFLRVALIANVRVKLVYFSQACAVSASVRRVTVRTFHRPLNDPMIIGKIKLGLDVSMAGETEIGLFCFQKHLGDLGSMNLMAVIAAKGT